MIFQTYAPGCSTQISIVSKHITDYFCFIVKRLAPPRRARLETRVVSPWPRRDPFSPSSSAINKQKVSSSVLRCSAQVCNEQPRREEKTSATRQAGKASNMQGDRVYEAENSSSPRRKEENFKQGESDRLCLFPQVKARPWSNSGCVWLCVPLQCILVAVVKYWNAASLKLFGFSPVYLSSHLLIVWFVNEPVQFCWDPSEVCKTSDRVWFDLTPDSHCVTGYEACVRS